MLKFGVVFILISPLSFSYTADFNWIVLLMMMRLTLVTRRGKNGGIWASSAQKDLRLQKDYANSN
jgi:hypothetical protein